MAKQAMVSNLDWVVKSLGEIRKGGRPNISYHLTRQLEGEKLITPIFVKVGGRGRPTKLYGLTKRGSIVLSNAQYDANVAAAAAASN